MRGKLFVLTALWLFGSVLVMADMSLARDERFRARLRPCCGDPEPKAEGRAERRVRPDGMRDRFRVNVEIPIPSEGLGIETPDEARSADVRLSLSRGGTPYAECFLQLDDPQEVEDQAEYQVDLRRLGSFLRQRKGACDTDLGTDGIQSGIPDVQERDVATATVVSDDSDIPFLEGTFEMR